MNLYSIIIPSYNESNNIDQFFHKFEELKLHINYNIELVFVDDGSNDDTWNKIIKYKDKFNIKGIKKIINEGKNFAILDGLKMINGNIAVFMDVDLQHPLETLEEMILISQKSQPEIILTDRLDHNKNAFRKVLTYLYNNFLNKNDLYISTINDFVLLSGRYLNFFKSNYDGSNSIKIFLLKSLKSIDRDLIDIIKYKSEERKIGKSKFNFFSLGEIAIRDLNYQSKFLSNFIIFSILSTTIISLSLLIFMTIQMIFFNNFLYVNFSTFLILIALIIMTILLLGIYVLFYNLIDLKRSMNRDKHYDKIK